MRADGEPAESVGRAVPGYEVAIVTADGTPEPAGAVGEVGIRGTGSSPATIAPGSARASLLRERLVPHRDIGTLDAPGG
jgi:acyl-coenzyme A synthetase/AMP-(fatty) acid ligase